MATVERFEDLKCRQKARVLTNSIYDLTLHPGFATDFRLKNQIQKAAGPVMHIIAEGFDAGTDADFVLFLKMTRRSASDAQSELYLALDRKYIDAKELYCSYDLATETKRFIKRPDWIPECEKGIWYQAGRLISSLITHLLPSSIIIN